MSVEVGNRPRERMNRGARSAIVMIVFAATVLACVFALPWTLPAPVRTIQSVSQAVGFNNRVAMLALAFGALGLFALAYRWRRRSPGAVQAVITVDPVPENLRVDPRVMRAAIAAVMLGVVGLGVLWQTWPTSDAAYFIDRLNRVIAGGAPFSEIEFSYGPALLYLPLVAWRLTKWTGVSIHAVYYSCVAIAYIIGLQFTAYLTNRVTGRRAVRNAVVILVAVFAIMYPTLGLNYSPLRFLLPYVMLVWLVSRLARARRGAGEVILPLIAVAVTATVSPEMALALFAALALALALLSLSDWRRHAPSLVVLLAGTATISWMMLGAGAGTFGAFVGGSYYLPVLPGLPALLFVATILLLAWGLGRTLPHRGETRTVETALQAGWLVLAVALIAPALGRCDFVHVFWNGLGAIVVCAAILERERRRGMVYLGLVATVFLGSMLLYDVSYFAPLMIDAGVRAVASSPDRAATLAQLAGRSAEAGASRARESAEAAARHEQAAAELRTIDDLAYTLLLSDGPGAELAMSGDLIPLYCDPAGALTDSDYLGATEQLGRASTLALPTASLLSYRAAAETSDADSRGVVMAVPTSVGEKRTFGVLLGLPVELEPRFPIFNPRASFGSLLQNDWVPYKTVADYTLLRRRAPVEESVRARTLLLRTQVTRTP